MNNGMPINSVSKADVNDPVSGYDTEFPWKNRDPRFYLNFGFDTRKMVNSTATAEAKQYTYANLYDGVRVGNYRSSRASGSNTGYCLMKFNPLGLNRYDNAYNNHQIHIPWMRLSDVYFDVCRVHRPWVIIILMLLQQPGIKMLFMLSNKVRNRVISS